MRAWESRPDLMVANEMRRDSNNIRMGDCVGFSLDTFHDGRNAYQFEVNPLGARTDGQSANERQYNSDWNPVWDLAVGRFDGGWTVEAAIPFKSLRYQPGAPRSGASTPAATTNGRTRSRFSPAFHRRLASAAAALPPRCFQRSSGIDAPPGSKNLEIKPYAIADVTTDRAGVAGDRE